MSNYSRGADRERQVKARYEARGYCVIRAAGSHSPADLVCLRAGTQTLLVQVKSDVRGPFAHFGPAERTELKGAATQAGAVAVLVYWPANKNPRYIFESGWPL